MRIKIKHEIYKFDSEKLPLRFGVFIPGIKFEYKETYDEIDLVVELPTVLEACKYEYGYTFTLKVFGFGFNIWFGNNI